MTGAVFFDRDGTLNYDVGYLGDVGGLRLLPGAREAVTLVRERGFRAVVVTNQAGIGRGLVLEADVVAVNARLSEVCGGVDLVLYCPHAPGENAAGPREPVCACRKPRPGMLWRARDELGVDLQHSFLIGDSRSDIEAARAAGCRGVLVRSGNGERTLAEPGGSAIWDHVANDALAAVRWLLEESSE